MRDLGRSPESIGAGRVAVICTHRERIDVAMGVKHTLSAALAPARTSPAVARASRAPSGKLVRIADFDYRPNMRGTIIVQ
jgi:hypothetical protein